jgi:hypothetical protein
MDALKARIAELETAIDRQVAVFEKHDDPNHPVVLAAERRIERLSVERQRVAAERKRLDSHVPTAPSVDLGSVLQMSRTFGPPSEAMATRSSPSSLMSSTSRRGTTTTRKHSSCQ